jgi:hypothetical protein
MSSGLIGKGTTVGISTTEGGSYTLVGEVIDATPPDEDMPADIEMTHYTSPNNKLEWKSSGWEDTGEASFQINFVPGQWQTLRLLKGVTRWYKFTYNDGSYDTYEAFIKRMSKTVPIKDRMVGTITLKGAGGRNFVGAS